MKQSLDLQQAVSLWVNRDFNHVPDVVFEELAKHNEDMFTYDHDLLRMLASPRVECSECGCQDDPVGEEDCPECGCNESLPALPQYAFPVGWGTLFCPKESLDEQFIQEHLEEIADLGFYVFESDLFGVLLGIDGGGYDFYEAHWTPLYNLRGLEWHSEWPQPTPLP